MNLERIREFVSYHKQLEGDEKSEAQVFCDRLFRAFGHEGYLEAGAKLEYRLKAKGKKTKYPDLVWKNILLMEMKSSKENLQRHYAQAAAYWYDLVPNRPKYMVLCNFDEFWIYDFDIQMNEPVDKVALKELPDRYTAFNFLLPIPKEPQFKNNLVDVTKEAADRVAKVYNALVARKEDPILAQRFILQCVVAMFAEDTDLLPKGFFTQLVADCQKGGSSYDLIGGLFRQMASDVPAKGGKYKGIKYFNGGIFKQIDAFDLKPHELGLLFDAATENWSRVQPPIFGTLFQSSMGKEERHAFGAHYTSEVDIQKVVHPTIVRPWLEKINTTFKLADLLALREELLNFHVLDPACGSGNFLYVAYRELKRIEFVLLDKIHSNFGQRTKESVGSRSHVSIQQMHGIEKNAFGAELAKITLMLAKELAITEGRAWFEEKQMDLPMDYDVALPLDNLDENIKEGDALVVPWPASQAIVGNPPYQSKNKAQDEYGRAYLNRLPKLFPGVPGKADYCVYWVRRAHDLIPDGCRVGLVGTNTIRQNYSRIGGLDYVLANGGTITEAVSSQVWSGEASVHVSIVNWVKGKQDGKKKLSRQLGDRLDSLWEYLEVDRIGASLSASVDVTTAIDLDTNAKSDTCYQGITHGHKGFLLTVDAAKAYLHSDKKNADVLFPYMISNDLVATKVPQPGRYVIDLSPRTIHEAEGYPKLFARIKEKVLGKRQEALTKEVARNKEAKADDPKARVNRHHKNFLNKWWLLSYPRTELVAKIVTLPRFVVCGRVTKRPIFDFLCPTIRPGDALQVFAFADDYSFGILQSGIHWQWFIERCSTFKRDFRYTSETVFNTFPWPQAPKPAQVKKVAEAGVALRQLRRELAKKTGKSFRELYRTLDGPGASPMKDAQAKLDAAVRACFGMSPKADPLAFLLNLNHELAKKEKAGEKVTKPGLPPSVKDPKPFITTDCIKP